MSFASRSYYGLAASTVMTGVNSANNVGVTQVGFQTIDPSGEAFGSPIPAGATVNGAVVWGVKKLISNGNTVVLIEGTRAQSFFTSVSIAGGTSRTSASASYFQQPTYAQWIWTAANDTFTNGSPSTVVFT